MPVHGVVVVHGVSQGRTRGSFLAEVAEGVADVLDERGGKVTRHFRAARGEHGDDVGTMPRGTITAEPRGGAEAHERHEYRFIEAFWDDAFPPPSRSNIAGRVLQVANSQVVQSLRALSDVSNGRRGEPQSSPTATSTTVPVPPILRLIFGIELAVLFALVLVGWALAIPLTLAILLMVLLSETPGVRLFGLWDRVVIPFVDRLDPFLTQNLGDATTIVERGMWSANARRRVEISVEALLNEGVDDIAIVAYSGGAGIVFTALLEGSNIADQLAHSTTKLAFVSVGSGINRMHLIARKLEGHNDVARNIVTLPFDSRLSERTVTSVEDVQPRDRFYWIDIYARLDPIAAGRVREDIVIQTGIDPTQLKVRQVINFDTPHEDHGGYFSNADLVVPRLVRSISGGDYPWPAERPENAPEPQIEASGDEADANDRSSNWPYLGARRRLQKLAILASVRALLVVGVVAHFVALRLSDDWLGKVERFLDRLDGWIVWLGERIPAIDWIWDNGESAAAVSSGQLLAVFGVLVIALAIDRLARFTLFERA